MKPDAILQSDVLDIIFEERNKEYGAYELRKHYNRRLIMATCIVFILTALVLSLQKFYTPPVKNHIVKIPVSDTLTPVIVIVQPPAPDIVPPGTTIAGKTVNNAIPVITKDEITDAMPTIETLLSPDVAMGLLNIDGPPAEGPSANTPSSGEGNGAEVFPEEIKEEKIFNKAERMPEFPGGMSGLRRFLSKSLKMPEDQLGEGEKVRVVVRFVVNSDGSISSIEFSDEEKKIFQSEVLRVIKKMPKWNPGYQNGRMVRVYITIPIVFESMK